MPLNRPTLGGYFCFGEDLTITPDGDRPEVITSFFATDGRGVENTGGRGVRFTITGTHGASNLPGLAAEQAPLRTLNDGYGRNFIDDTGREWYPTIVDTFEPQNPTRRTPAGWYTQDYALKLIYLGPLT